MNIGIMSMQDINNFGSLLQAYALKKILSMYGDVYFMPIRQLKEDQLVQFQPIIHSSEFERSNSMLDKIRKIDRYVVNRFINKTHVKKQDELFEAFRKTYLPCHTGQKIDACVIGSDEVFNCLQVSPWGYASRLFGNVDEANTVMTYAASCGYTSAEACSQDLKSHIHEAMSHLKAISVRDSNTGSFVERIAQRVPEYHLDPVLVGDFTEEMRIAEETSALPERFCIIYAYNNRFNRPEEISAIQRFCEKHRYVPVTIGAPQAWIKGMLCLSPFQALAAFAKADFVITDTFHGTIMAAKYCGKFAVHLRESNTNKLKDLMIRLNIENHLIDSWDRLEENLMLPDTRDQLEQLIVCERQKSIAYLEKGLKTS